MKIDYLKNHIYMIDEIAELFYKEWSFLVPERKFKEFKNGISERVNSDKIPLAIVAVEGDKLLGTVCLKKYDMESRKELSPWIAGLFVKEEYRKNGIGKKLVYEIENIAKKLEIAELYLYTPDAENFYRRLGWEIYEKTKYNGNEVSVMKKYLI